MCRGRNCLKKDCGEINEAMGLSLSHAVCYTMRMIKPIELKEIELGRARRFRNITVFPLHREAAPRMEYLALDVAMDNDLVEVTEVDAAGSVPDLLVKNRGKLPVLIIDGEEVVGAKQNRVVNTSILLPAKSTTKIPVSCTEAGRWEHTTLKFKKSDTVLYAKARARKMRAVSDSYVACNQAVSDQSEVWAQIHELESKSGNKSPTSSMKNVFEARQRDLDECLAALRPEPGQRGLVVCVGGKPLGCDYISRPEVYVRLHDKLLRSYVIDALLEQGRGKATRKDSARAFLRKTSTCKSRRYDAPGVGWDHRFEGKHIAGTALVHENEVLHQAFFMLEDENDPRRWRRLDRQS